MQLTNRTVLVTGGTSGISLALARLLAARGNAVAVTGREALIVDVTSGLAFVPYPLASVYSAAKAGLHAFTVVLRQQRLMFNQRARMSGALSPTPEPTR